jgi:transcription antitermination factor NusG
MEMNDTDLAPREGHPEGDGLPRRPEPHGGAAARDRHHQGQIEGTGIAPRPKVNFEVNDQVKVVDGAFANFTGVVEDVRPSGRSSR